MGKAFKWFRGLLRLKKSHPFLNPSPNSKLNQLKCHFKDNEKTHHHDAPAASPAVVKITTTRRTTPTADPHSAAIKIQAAFRGFLARKALRALRGLVRLQALVRGHIERKRTAEWIKRMQALLRAQARARAGRSQSSLDFLHSDIKFSSFSSIDPVTPEKFEHSPHTKSTRFKQMQRSGSRFTTIDAENIDRILEIENEKAHFKLKPKSLFSSIRNALSSSDVPSKQPPSSFSCETQCFSPFKFSHEVEENSFFSVSSRGGSTKKSPFTPAKSDSTRSYFSGDSEYPSYMACTESSRAKMRSHSAPRQRPQYERSSSAKRGSAFIVGESRLTAQQVSTLRSNFVGKAYPGSGRLDKLGMPVGYRY
ncbi:hypothetical protein IC582_022330 [Cucumis melo]|uniref:Protein IQ-DOMAIN 14 isoform X1 n=2 Tax=Cucumis melo TaxID=3656 RepID=A0A5A7THB3_CUCMM|nr:protein IQ-DOMAIN 22 isoform X1 [Cucumis melo]KAA0042792.1 protein IQ-DOMAIN 14 isoform X1 [Cucumis melo var. makuwa]